MNTLLRLFAFPLALILIPLPSMSEPVYRWRDGSGSWIFGSRPPPDAERVEKVVGRPVSRYSSDKLIKAFRPEHVPLAKVDARASLGSVKETDLFIGVAKLEHGEVAVATDEEGRITSCMTKVRNTGGEPAADVSVAFQFAEGTLVPASGPHRVETKQEADYAIAPEQLPVKLKSSTADASGTSPEVVMRFISEGAPAAPTAPDDTAPDASPGGR